MALIDALTDLFQPPTGRSMPKGADWREASDAALERDIEDQRRINTPGWKFEDGENVVVPMRPVPKYSPQQNSDEIERLNNRIYEIRRQIIELQDEETDLLTERTAQFALWVEHSEKIKVLDAMRKAMAGEDI